MSDDETYTAFLADVTSHMRPDDSEPGHCLTPVQYAEGSTPLPETPCSTPGTDTDLPPEAYDLICANLAEEISGGRLREILRGKYGWTGPQIEATINAAIDRGIRSATTFGSPSDSGRASDTKAPPGSSPTTGADQESPSCSGTRREN